MSDPKRKGLNAYQQHAGNARDELVKQNLPLVKKIVLHMAGSLGRDISRDDLLQAGMIGLLEAAGRYQPDKNVPFDQYAKLRIRGAVIDELRHWDWRSRSDRENGKQIRDTLQKLNNRLERAPTEKEIADELNVSIERYRRMLQTGASVSLLSLDLLMQGEADSSIIEINDDDSVEVVAIDGKRTQAMIKALKNLPEREQQILNLYYTQELNMKEVGKLLDLTEARICQLHRQSILRLRSLLEDWNRKQ